jgi:mono/diheme cytochrome c family protein/glucose/arabinose dehydrogenase
MYRLRFFLAATLILAAVTTGSSVPRSWLTELQPVADESPVLSPGDELKTFRLPQGYRMELVASEPLIQEPVVIDWDTEGRLWAVEMLGYMNDMQASHEHDPVGRVVVLEDTDRDGRMDRRTVFADGLVLPRALKVLDRGVLVGEPPHLWLMKDTNGDMKADTKDLVADRFGRPDANPEHNANSLLWALDNWIYTSESDMFLRLKDGAFEVRTTLSRGQWGASQDDGGRVFRNSNESALHADLVPTPYYARNPALTRTRGSDEFLGGMDEDLNAVWPVHPTRGVNRGYQAGILREDGTLARFTAACAPTVYRGDRLPAELYGNVFVAEPAGNLVSRIIVSDEGRTLRGRKAYPRGEFVASTDERFRPVYLSSAPDGTLYVVDMYRGVIQHRTYITEYLHDQILSRHLEQPIGRGRIWRVVHESTRRRENPSLTKAAAARLVDLLLDPNGWWRDTAQRLLVERKETTGLATPALVSLKKLATEAAEARTRLHALWTLDGLDILDAKTVARALGDKSRDVRMSAIRLAERWLRGPDPAVQAAFLALASDPDWAVRDQLAASLGELSQPTKESAIAAFLERNATDPIAVDAALSGLKGSEAAVLEKVLSGNDETPERATAITMLAATIVSGAQEPAVQKLFDTIGDSARATWQRSALIRGAEVTLLGDLAPGSTPRRAPGRGRGTTAGESCPTCPGARSGPGGASAFPRDRNEDEAILEGRGSPGPRSGRNRGGGTSLALTREPSPLTALASAGAGELSARATALLARIEWPGKPGTAAVTPLTPAEQARFDAGRVLYQNICLPCHQANGRGLERTAPPLVGSEFALGPPAIPIRILLGGKEGSTGLMPPLGASLSDEQIADVLTYIRREWGQGGSPVDPALIAPVRAETAGRTRPWTNDELAKLAGRH